MDSLVDALYKGSGNLIKRKFSDAGQQKAILLLDSIGKGFNKTTKDKEQIMLRLTLKSVKMDYRAEYSGAFWNIIRDKNMFERISWLADEIYPNEKIIIWAASGHMVRNMVSIKRKEQSGKSEYYPYYQTGDWLFSKYKNQFYSMVFTTASGETGKIYPESHKNKKFEKVNKVDKPLSGSFEDIAYKSEKKSLFCNLRTLKKDCWLNKEFTAYPLGYQEDYTKWKDSVDGFIFMREMKPDAVK